MSYLKYTILFSFILVLQVVAEENDNVKINVGVAQYVQKEEQTKLENQQHQFEQKISTEEQAAGELQGKLEADNILTKLHLHHQSHPDGHSEKSLPDILPSHREKLPVHVPV
ncbi:hypothetical protein TKK_0001873 [Trichogramma kaykai]